jgi:hypothetical protein
VRLAMPEVGWRGLVVEDSVTTYHVSDR